MIFDTKNTESCLNYDDVLASMSSIEFSTSVVFLSGGIGLLEDTSVPIMFTGPND